jgi:hypothetical protein
MKRTSGIETTTVTEHVKPASVNVNAIELTLRLTIAFTFVGAIAAVLLFAGGIMALAHIWILPLFGFMTPIALRIVFDLRTVLRYEASIGRQQRIIELQERAAIREFDSDLNDDGIVNEQDVAIQRKRESDLADFVRRVWLLNQPHSKSHWVDERGVSFDGWQWLTQQCIDGGLLNARTDAAGRTLTTKRDISYQAALWALRDAGKFQITNPLADFEKGTYTKNHGNPVASDGASSGASYDGPVSTLDY